MVIKLKISSVYLEYALSDLFQCHLRKYEESME